MEANLRELISPQKSPACPSVPEMVVLFLKYDLIYCVAFLGFSIIMQMLTLIWHQCSSFVKEMVMLVSYSCLPVIITRTIWKIRSILSETSSDSVMTNDVHL